MKFKTFVIAILLVISSTAYAGDFYWSIQYQFNNYRKRQCEPTYVYRVEPVYEVHEYRPRVVHYYRTEPVVRYYYHSRDRNYYPYPPVRRCDW